MTIVYQCIVGMEYLQLVCSWDEITTTGISKWWLVHRRDEISIWDDWYTVVMTGHRKTQSAASDCVCGPFGTSMQPHHQHHYHINNNDNYHCYSFQFFCFGSFHHLHHRRTPTQNNLLQDPRFNPSLDNPPGYRWSFTEQEKKSPKKMSHLHSRKYIFIKETCHFILEKIRFSSRVRKGQNLYKSWFQGE